MNIPEREKLENHLRKQYSGIFTDSMVQQHIDDYIGFNFPEQMYQWLSSSSPNVKKILDIGCGYGAFVLLCRMRGVDARGIELEGFEIEYAQRRLKNEISQDIPEEVYIKGTANNLPFENSSFDAVTMWNVLEHIKYYKRTLKETYRVLKPGGDLYVICPNYFAFRKEAHYLVPWIPFMPKYIGKYYLRLLNKNSSFYEEYIYHRNNWSLLFSFFKTNFRLFSIQKSNYIEKIKNPEKIGNTNIRYFVNLIAELKMQKILYCLLRIKIFISNVAIYNPFKNSVVLHLNKEKGL